MVFILFILFIPVNLDFKVLPDQRSSWKSASRKMVFCLKGPKA